MEGKRQQQQSGSRSQRNGNDGAADILAKLGVAVSRNKDALGLQALMRDSNASQSPAGPGRLSLQGISASIEALRSLEPALLADNKVLKERHLKAEEHHNKIEAAVKGSVEDSAEAGVIDSPNIISSVRPLPLAPSPSGS